MESLINVSSYIFNRYQQENNCKIDEMKLHKLLYFAQRESLILNNEPLFKESFYAWKYGPVLKEVRVFYSNNSFLKDIPDSIICRIKKVMDSIFVDYSHKDSWSLSRLSHGEISWKLARNGLSDGENGNVKMLLENIRLDAQNIKNRRKALSALGLI